MHREQALPQVRRAFEVGEDVSEEVIRVGVAGILVMIDGAIWGGSRVRRRCEVAIIKDDDLVDAENGSCSSYLPS